MARCVACRVARRPRDWPACRACRNVRRLCHCGFDSDCDCDADPDDFARLQPAFAGPYRYAWETCVLQHDSYRTYLTILRGLEMAAFQAITRGRVWVIAHTPTVARERTTHGVAQSDERSSAAVGGVASFSTQVIGATNKRGRQAGSPVLVLTHRPRRARIQPTIGTGFTGLPGRLAGC